MSSDEQDARSVALRKLLDDAELREEFARDPQSVLTRLGLSETELTELQSELSDEGATLVAERRSKSAWFGGTPFG